MPAVAYGYPSVDIAPLAMKCWQQSLCARTSDHISEANSLHSEQITVHSVGSRDSGTETECWLANIYCWGSFQSHSNIVRGHSIQTRTACLANVVSVNVQTVWCRQKISRCRKIMKKLKWWSCPAKLGWRQHSQNNSRRILFRREIILT